MKICTVLPVILLLFANMLFASSKKSGSIKHEQSQISCLRFAGQDKHLSEAKRPMKMKVEFKNDIQDQKTEVFIDFEGLGLCVRN